MLARTVPVRCYLCGRLPALGLLFPVPHDLYIALVVPNVGPVPVAPIPRRTVGENVGLALEVLGTPRDVINRRVNAVLSIVGLRGRADEYPPTLSGGEQQRVAVARAIVNDPSILLADEPTGNLDGAMAIEVMEILQAINLRGTTVLVATHDAGLMQRFPYRVLRFRAGKLVES